MFVTRIDLLRLWNAAGSDWRRSIGVLEVNFVEPPHDKQGFERTTILSRLEDKLIQMQKTYWSQNSDSEDIEIDTHGFTKDGIPEAKYVVRIDLVGGFAIQKVTSERSYFWTIGNMDIKIDFVPSSFINFISRQLIGSDFRLYQKLTTLCFWGSRKVFSCRKPEFSMILSLIRKDDLRSSRSFFICSTKDRYSLRSCVFKIALLLLLFYERTFPKLLFDCIDAFLWWTSYLNQNVVSVNRIFVVSYYRLKPQKFSLLRQSCFNQEM